MKRQPNQQQIKMCEALDTAASQLLQARLKAETGDIHGAQARVVFAQRQLADFMEESVACPKTETGYAR